MPRISQVAVVVVLSLPMSSCARPRGGSEPGTQEVAWRRDSTALADSLAILLGAHDTVGRNPAADVDATSFLFVLRKAGAQASATTLAHIAQRYRQISTALPTLDGLQRNEVDARHDWSSAIGLYDPGANGDEIVRVVQAEVSLDGGAIVRQAYDTTLGGVVSAATCDAHGAVIAYNPRMLAALAVGSVRFLQQHELAHFALRHVDCGRLPLVDEHYTERAADCWAVARLEGRVPVGIVAIGAATQLFKTLHEPAELPHYESSDSRATYIDKFCK